MTNRAYQKALSETGLLHYDAYSKILSTTFETLKFLSVIWRHAYVISSQDSTKIDHKWSWTGRFRLKICWHIHSCEKNIWNSAKRNDAYSRIIFEWYGVVLEHISGSFHFQHDYNWRGILYFFSCQFWFFIFEPKMMFSSHFSSRNFIFIPASFLIRSKASFKNLFN